MKRYLVFTLIILIIFATLQIACSSKKDLVFADSSENPGDDYERSNWDFRDLRLGNILKIQDKYWLYYSGANYYYDYGVGVAESSDFMKWLKYSSNPIMSKDDKSIWEFIGIQAMSVVFDGSEYFMWYDSVDNHGNKKICHAHSDDGINWEKYDNNPVIEPDIYKPSEENSVLEPDVFFYKNRFFMAYTSYGIGEIGDSFINIATSDDGINWEKYENNPVIEPGKDWESGGVYEPTIYCDKNTIRMLYSGNDRTADGRVVKVGFASSIDGSNWFKEGKTNLYAYMNDMNY